MTVELQRLDDAARTLMRESAVLDTIAALKRDVQTSEEPFVWATIDSFSEKSELPEEIKSCWIFVLKKDVPSGCHYHPNSVQHMLVVEGEGRSEIGGNSKEMVPFDDDDYSVNDKWYVIGQGVPHEFFPRVTDMVVISFHTCRSEELEEISCGTSASRVYAPGS